MVQLLIASTGYLYYYFHLLFPSSVVIHFLNVISPVFEMYRYVDSTKKVCIGGLTWFYSSVCCCSYTQPDRELPAH